MRDFDHQFSAGFGDPMQFLGDCDHFRQMFDNVLGNHEIELVFLKGIRPDLQVGNDVCFRGFIDVYGRGGRHSANLTAASFQHLEFFRQLRHLPLL